MKKENLQKEELHENYYVYPHTYVHMHLYIY